MTRCPDCEWFDEPDAVALHLINFHDWDTDKATVWLREQVEEKALEEQP